MMADPRGPPGDKSIDLPGAFGHYWQYAKLWRTWVVGIAIGALFILLNKDVGGTFESRANISVLFVVAAGLQVALAWINKTSAYYEYRQEKLKSEGKEATLSPWGRFWCWLGDKYCIDFTIDLVSLVLVGIAVYVMVTNIFAK